MALSDTPSAISVEGFFLLLANPPFLSTRESWLRDRSQMSSGKYEH
jgi:hypothetical protein